MNKHYQNYLEKKYPHLYKSRYGGFAVGDGWFDLINHLSYMLCKDWLMAKNEYDYVLENQMDWFGKAATEESLNAIKAKVDAEAAKIPVALQVKEKFGALRFYVSNCTDAQYSHIDFAENMSTTICERCGARGKQRRTGWISTLCNKHAAERMKQYEDY